MVRIYKDDLSGGWMWSSPYVKPKARFAEAAAARGERVIVTKHGRPFVELVAARSTSGMDFEKAAAVRHALGLDGLQVDIPADFDDPAFSRLVLGLED
jgi:antitoxin (DNA-binding transcriptional repressor) of toxin-antitoxin stability system